MNQILYLNLILVARLSSGASQCDNTFPDGRVCGPSDWVELEDAASCYHYYMCDHGCVTHETCPEGTRFDSLYSFCNTAEAVDCGGRPCDDLAHCPPVTTQGPDCLPPDQQVDCRDLGPGLFPDDNNCRYYWHCSNSNSEPDHILCGDDNQGRHMMYNLQYDGCDYADNTDCGARPVCDECNQHCYDQVDDNTDCGHPLDCSVRPDGYYPDPYSCVKYWICVGGVGYHNMCPPDQYYEPALVRCDWSGFVDCGSRPPCNECEVGCP